MYEIHILSSKERVEAFFGVSGYIQSWCLWSWQLQQHYSLPSPPTSTRFWLQKHYLVCWYWWQRISVALRMLKSFTNLSLFFWIYAIFRIWNWWEIVCRFWICNLNNDGWWSFLFESSGLQECICHRDATTHASSMLVVVRTIVKGYFGEEGLAIVGEKSPVSSESF